MSEPVEAATNKADFYSNHGGGPVLVLCLCVAHAPALSMLLALLRRNARSLRDIQNQLSRTSRLFPLSHTNLINEFVIEFALFVIPLIIIMTIGSAYLHISLASIVLIDILLFFCLKTSNPSIMSPANSPIPSHPSSPRDQTLLSSPSGATAPSQQRTKHGRQIGLGMGGGGMGNTASNGNGNSSGSNKDNMQGYLTLFKGGNMLMTCIAILAVDFRIFPRSFAKTETFGVSLMDIGIGFFIISSSITSRFARNISTKSQQVIGVMATECLTLGVDDTRERDQHAHSNPHPGMLANLRSTFTKGTLWRHFAVLLLGIGRMILLKLFSYHEHVSEYGIHWNFFVTLFFVWTLAEYVHRILPRRYIPFFAVALIGIYQYLLLSTPLTNYILYAPRSGFISSNREGLVSVIGGLALYLLGECLSYYLFFSQRSGSVGGYAGQTSSTSSSSSSSASSSSLSSASAASSSSLSLSSSTAALSVSSMNTAAPSPSTSSSYLTCWPISSVASSLNISPTFFSTLSDLCIVQVVLWSLWLACDIFVQSTSRRLMNASFVLISLALAFQTITFFYLITAVVMEEDKSLLQSGNGCPIALLDIINIYQLPTFILANLLTGLVNVSMQTISASPPRSCLILFSYCLVLCGAIWFIGFRRQKRTS